MKRLRVIILETASSLFSTMASGAILISRIRLWFLLCMIRRIIFSANFSLEGLNIARVQRNGKWGYVNKEGKEVIPVIYDQIRDYFFKGICEAMRDGK